MPRRKDATKKCVKREGGGYSPHCVCPKCEGERDNAFERVPVRVSVSPDTFLVVWREQVINGCTLQRSYSPITYPQ